MSKNIRQLFWLKTPDDQLTDPKSNVYVTYKYYLLITCMQLYTNTVYLLQKAFMVYTELIS